MVQGDDEEQREDAEARWSEACQWLFRPAHVPPHLLKKCFKKVTTTIGILTIVLTCTCGGILAAELVRANHFYNRSIERMEHPNKQHKEQIYDRDGKNISTDQWRHLVGINYTERGMMTVFVCGQVMLLLASGGLFRAGGQGIRQFAIPWLGLIPINAVYGTVLTALDCVIYGLHTENIAVLTFWLVIQVIYAICYRTVMAYFIRLPSSNPLMGMAVFDPGSPDDTIFVIGGHTDRQGQPVTIMLTPPSYVDALADDDYVKPPEDGEQEVPTDKPPDYEP